MKELYTPCYLCHDVVREGSRRFDALEPPRTSVRAPCTKKNSTHLAISVMVWFEKVQGGSIRLNHPKLVHKHPAHLLPLERCC